MITEQAFLEKWRSLPLEQQQEVFYFIEYLSWRRKSVQESSAAKPVEQPKTASPLGQRLRQIRAEIVASGSPLLNWKGIEQEKIERQGEHQEND